SHIPPRREANPPPAATASRSPSQGRHAEEPDRYAQNFFCLLSGRRFDRSFNKVELVKTHDRRHELTSGAFGAPARHEGRADFSEIRWRGLSAVFAFVGSIGTAYAATLRAE